MLTRQVFNVNQQIIFIDSNVSDYQTLLGGADPQAEIVILDVNRSGIEQITETLAAKQNVEAVHIISHGSAGSVQLGSDILNGESLESFSSQIQKWRKALTEGADILLYGCDVAAGEIGENFVQRLSEITGADVAASTDLTGNAALGGDWELEKTTGSIEADLAFSDEARSAYNGILAPKDTALTLNGGYVSLPSNPSFNISTNRLTVETWLKPNFTSPWEAIVAKGDSAWRLARSSSSNNLEFAFNSTTGVKYVTGNANVNDNQWHHVAAVYDGTNVLLYVDGVLDAQSNVGSAIFSTNSYNVRIGSNEQVTGSNYTGQIDEVRVWNVARTQAQIQANKDISISSAAGLIGNWNFNEGTGTATADASGNSNNGTLTGSVNWTVNDTTPPTVALTSAAAATVNAPFAVTATFSESTTNFIASDISLTNGTVSGFSGSGTTYNFTVTPTGQGTVTVNVPTGVATDAAGNNNTAATALTRTFDSVAPTVALTSAAAATVNAPFAVTATFSESTSNFIASDISLTNGTVSGFSGSGTTYT
ncbi:DUF4347 domain-containing protein, partial [Microcoleus sp. ARI1-A5]|uniref:DUF4347 domain-containing protein n=2 Tax=unclassified Microcoleus TaxID=2642155 RepID=UPI002FD1FB10